MARPHLQGLQHRGPGVRRLPSHRRHHDAAHPHALSQRRHDHAGLPQRGPLQRPLPTRPPRPRSAPGQEREEVRASSVEAITTPRRAANLLGVVGSLIAASFWLLIGAPAPSAHALLITTAVAISQLLALVLIAGAAVRGTRLWLMALLLPLASLIALLTSGY